MARNRSIFKGEKVVISKIVAKIIGMTTEKLAVRGLGLRDEEDMPSQVSKWCNIFFHRSSLQAKNYHSRQPWEIRKNYEDLLRWIKKQNSFSLFFDGASKGNSGEVGAGGLL